MSFPSIPLASISFGEVMNGFIWYNGFENPMTCTISCECSETQIVLEYSPSSISDAKAAIAQMYGDPAWHLEFYDYA